MSTLDHVISCLHRNIDEIQRAMAELEVVKSQMEEVAGQFEAVGMEGNSAVAAATIDWIEQTQAQFQEALAQVEAQIPVAEALKTGGSFAASARGETPNASGPEAKPGYIATTGADPTPNPIHATPAHTREPSRKVGDPVKPVETEPEKDVKMSRFARLGRQKVRDTEDWKDSVEDMVQSAEDLLGRSYDPWGSDVRTETHTSPSQPQVQAPHTQEPGTPEIVGTFTVLGIVMVESCSRLWERRVSSRRAKNEGRNDD